MTKQAAVSVQGIGKAYRLGAAIEKGDTLVAALGALLATPLKNLRGLRRLETSAADHDSADTIWALKNVSFQIPEGQTLGIVGRNGAGKSTLLRILSRITTPTVGRVEIRGRVSSLLEVGTGFHPELTGRENVYLNGSILGMRQQAINAKFDEIAAFSGVERFLDTPVKRYSSGMKVRLAFSVAAHLDPEILIVDEVLAVGDADFQSRCLGKMQGFAQSGRTVMFVSHNMGAVQTLCSRAIALRNGELVDDGQPAEVVARYLAQMCRARVDSFATDNPERVNTGIFRFLSGQVLERHGHATDKVLAGDTMVFRLAYESDRRLDGVSIGLTVYNEFGVAVTTLNSRRSGFHFGSTEGRGAVTCTLAKTPFVLGNYHIDVVARHQGQVIDEIPAALRFTVADSVFFPVARKSSGRERGLVYVSHDWAADTEF